METFLNHRILVIDDNESIHQDFQYILEKREDTSELGLLESELFGEEDTGIRVGPGFHVDFALQGQEGLAKTRAACERNEPYAVAFVDMRMPPGWDGLETIERLWDLDADMQIVICTAYSDYSWDQIAARLGPSDKLLILKKPFDPAEVQQIATALTRKWQLTRETKQRSEELELNVLRRTARLREANDTLEESLAKLKETQAQLIQSEKMAALGGLVAGLAHEVNTPIGIGVTASSYLAQQVKQYVEESKKRKLTDADISSLLAVAKESSRILLTNLNRAAELIRSFKDIAVDQSSSERRMFNVSKYVDEIMVSLAPQLKRTEHEVHVQCPANLLIDSYPGIVSQVLTNFIVNSLVHAFDNIKKGRIDIIIQSKYRSLIIVYRDNGKGIPEENLDKIFEPFFTTKRGRGGSGLGLHIVYNLVTQSLSGAISCTSAAGEGTTFEVTIPDVVQEGF